MQLLMTMEQSRARIVGEEVNFCFLVAAQHQYVLQHTSGWLAGQLRQLKTVPVQMDGMNIVAGVAHPQPIALRDVGGDDGIRTRGLCRDTAAFARN